MLELVLHCPVQRVPICHLCAELVPLCPYVQHLFPLSLMCSELVPFVLIFQHLFPLSLMICYYFKHEHQQTWVGLRPWKDQSYSQRSFKSLPGTGFNMIGNHTALTSVWKKL
ncbi:hypothetical protein AVEN_90948-1 [Araneus ventricosus]|uniref:Uncharacterized protein n=1 Tax=Araneus ventricosus TaxID=182803 RepID=A0A4Y2GZ51_ARAVE|nr:hypothetical protein AVEN_90948-1 [Araneus ventricosus]